MRRTARLMTMAAVVLAMTAVAGAGEKARVISPSIEVHQVGGLPLVYLYEGPVAVEYEFRVYNPSLEPITLTRIDLRSISPVTSYVLRSNSRPYEVTIAPDGVEIVSFVALAYARSDLVGAMTPVNLKGVMYFDSADGGFAKRLTHIVTPKSQRTDS